MGVEYRHISDSDFAKENGIIAIINIKMTYYYSLENGTDVWWVPTVCLILS